MAAGNAIADACGSGGAASAAYAAAVATAVASGGCTGPIAAALARELVWVDVPRAFYQHQWTYIIKETENMLLP